MKTTKRFIVLLFLVLLCFSCSTKKDAFLNRNYHAVTTEFNILYNGQLAFDKGIEEINNNYNDDFWEPIPIEPIEFNDDNIQAPKFNPPVAGPGSSFGRNQNQQASVTFERAEEKATKAIQRHSMQIYGVERNKQIDDAYLLLGKSRYYTQRFIPAIEAFNYIIKKYPKASLINETKIWKAKSNIRLDNEDVAIDDLLALLKKEKLEDAIKEQANTALAMAYQKKDSTKAVIDRLLQATKTDANVNQRARNLFVLGQVYAANNQRDSANKVFEKLASYKKGPFKYQLQGLMALSNNVENLDEVLTLIKRYKKVFPVWEYRHSLATVNYHLGILEEKRDSVDNAIGNYKATLLDKKIKRKLRSYAYERLAEIYFNTNKFFLASAYYDSVLSVDKEETLRILRIQRRRKALESVITYETILKKNDSILNIVLLTNEERVAYFQDYVNKLKSQDEINSKSVKKAIGFENSPITSNKKQSRRNRDKWYFYNSQSLSVGEAEFKRIWGNRVLEDNWRWSKNQKVANNRNNFNRTPSRNRKNATATFEKYNVQSYLSKIPTETVVIDSMQEQRSIALYELGLAYKEKIERDQLAIDRLERLLKSYPPKRLIMPTYYLLQELYGKQKESKGVFYKRRLIRKYPKTRYAQILSSPEGKEKSEQELKELTALYTLAYQMYKEEKFKEAITFINESLETTDNSPLIPKFELLRAYCIGKEESKELYKSSLEEVFKRYPNSLEGRKAAEVAKKL